MKALFYPSAGEAPQTIDLPKTLEAMQALVGGYVELVRMGKYNVYCNEDGRSKGLPPNRALPGGPPIVGPFYIVAYAGSNDRGLTDNEIDWLRKDLP
jgi:hypothetical protein